MKCRRLISPLLLLLLGPAGAQAPSPPPAAAPRPLSAALKALPPDALPANGPLLVVDADRALPPQAPQDAAPDLNVPPPDDTTLDGVAAHYAGLTQSFGPITALASAQMSVLNTNPDPLTLSPETTELWSALQVFVGSLTAAQLHQFSADGLTISDLTDEQRAFYEAAIPRPLIVVPAGLNYMDIYRNNPTPEARHAARAAYKASDLPLSASVFLDGARVRGCLVAEFTVSGPGEPQRFGASPVPTDAKPKNFQMSFDDILKNSAQWRQRDKLRLKVPNVPKDGDLRWDAEVLAKPIPLDGLRTVGDVIKKSAVITGLELHGDPRYTSKSVWFFGDASHPVPAADLLQALDLCLKATWRKVGPAYVLTDDLQGYAARRERIRQIVNAWNGALAKLTRDAGKNFAAQGGAAALAFAPGDPNALPPDLIQKFSAATDTPYQMDLAFGQLPAAAQAAVRASLQHDADGASDEPIALDDNHPEIKMSWKQRYQRLLGALRGATVTVALKMHCFLDAPNVGTIALKHEYEDLELPSAPPDPALAAAPEPLTLTQKTRGLLCAPLSPAEARAVVDRMAALGLNTLYCDVFSDGQTAFPNSALPPPAGVGGTLSAAIAEGQQKKIAVYAVLDTLRWRATETDHRALPLDAAQDVTITGDTARDALPPALVGRDPDDDITRLAVLFDGGAWVSPDDSTVQKTLTALVRSVAATPGLVGLVLQDTRGPGYEEGAYQQVDAIELGYTLPMRLAFLRAEDADPLDIPTGDGKAITLNNSDNELIVDIPGFSAYDDVGQRLETAWRAFRAARDHALMASLYAAARAVSPALPLLLRERSTGLALSPWVDAKAVEDLDSTAGTVLVLPLQPLQGDPSGLAPSVEKIQKHFGKDGSTGLVFDTVSGREAGKTLPALDALAALIQVPAPRAALGAAPSGAGTPGPPPPAPSAPGKSPPPRP